MSFLGGGISSLDPFNFGNAFGPDLAATPGNGTPAKSNTVTAQPWWSTLFGNANGVLNSVLAYKVQQNQVNHGQTPSVSAPGGNNTNGVGVNSLAPIIPLLVVIAIGLGIFKLFSGGRR